MRSFAVWYKSKTDSQDAKEATVHVNLWNREGRANRSYCFDFGFLIENLENLEEIYLYTPFQLKLDMVKDLGDCISNNKLVNGIFNEAFTTTEGEPKRVIVKSKTDEDNEFIIYSLDINSQVLLEDCSRQDGSPGSIIIIKTSSIQILPKDKVRYYFRLRVEPDIEDIKLINNQIEGVSVFSSHFTNTEVIDFRLNDIRSCSEQLREQFDKGQKFKIRAVHYLILRNANDIILHYGSEMNCRMLEKDLWSDYIDGHTSNIIAYHIKSKGSKVGKEFISWITDFSDLTRFQYKKKSFGVILGYIIIIVFLGSIGGVLGNWFTKILNISG